MVISSHILLGPKHAKCSSDSIHAFCNALHAEERQELSISVEAEHLLTIPFQVLMRLSFHHIPFRNLEFFGSCEFQQSTANDNQQTLLSFSLCLKGLKVKLDTCKMCIYSSMHCTETIKKKDDFFWKQFLH